MPSYKLNIDILSDNVREINQAYQKITIMKSVGDSAGVQVVWVSFSPFEKNEIRWEDEYGVYASNTTVQRGESIYKASVVNPATDGLIYPFENGPFGSPTSDGEKNAYTISNQGGCKFTFGLAQDVSVNGNVFAASPFNAVTLLRGQVVRFEPIEKIQVFLHGNSTTGTLTPDVQSPGLLLDFTHEPKQSIRYDGITGQFVIA